jgi:brassinosteroid-6-oxidase 1
MLREIIEERRASNCPKNDMLDSLLENDENSKAKLTDEQIIDLIIALIYSGYETVSTTSMMAVKYLSDHPTVLEELRVNILYQVTFLLFVFVNNSVHWGVLSTDLQREHSEIRKQKPSDYRINWEDYKSMRLTRAVIFETLRMATVVNGVLRKTTQDVEING